MPNLILDMAEMTSCSSWDEIDISERFMVCGLFNEACFLASTQIQNLRTSSLKPIHEFELSEMMESAGMVFVQSMRESGRTSEIFTELKILFGSVEAIPIDVFLTGACMQLSEGTTSNLSTIFEEFLEKWRHVDNNRYIFRNEHLSICPWQLALDPEKYLEVAEVFAVIFLGKVLRNPEIAITWTEKSELPEDKRQDMLKRLQEMQHALNARSSISPASCQSVEGVCLTSSGAEVLSKSTNSINDMNEHESKLASSRHTRPSIKHLTHRSSPFWWFTTVHFKLGGLRLALPQGRIILVGLMMAFASYLLRKKALEFRKIASRLGLSVQRALVDAWQLAFSVQVNPLAAVQQVSSSPRSNR